MNRKTRSRKTELLIILLLYAFSVGIRLSSVSSSRALYDPDSYYYYRLAESAVKNGYAGDTVRNGMVLDLHRNAPYGTASPRAQLIVWITVFCFRLVRIFAPVPLSDFVFFLPAFIGSLAVIPAYLFTEERAGRAGGITAAVMISCGIRYVSRTCPGFFDTDMFLAVLPLFFFLFLTKAVQAGNTVPDAGTLTSSPAAVTSSSAALSAASVRNKRLLYSALSFLFLLLLFFGWDGWALYAGIAGLFLFLYFLFVRRSFKAAVPLAVAGAAVLLFTNSWSDFLSYSGVVRENASGFPHIYISISEMQKMPLFTGGLSTLLNLNTASRDFSVTGVLNGTGGILAAWFSLKELFLLYRKSRTRTDALLFTVWLLPVTFLAVNKARFISLALLPAGLLSGMYIASSFSVIKIPKVRNVCASVLAAFLVLPSVTGAFRAARSSFSSPMTAQLSQTLSRVREITPPDTVIASWWDNGYLFEQAADRATFCDGGILPEERIFLTARALSDKNTALSAGIFRMLSASGEDAFREILKQNGNDHAAASRLLIRLLSGTKEAGTALLTSENGYAADAAEKLMSLVLPDKTRPVVLILTPDMGARMNWFSFFGNGYGTDETAQSGGSSASSAAGYSYQSPDLNLLPENGTASFRFGMNDGSILTVHVKHGTGSSFPSVSTELTDISGNSLEKEGSAPRFPLNFIEYFSTDGYQTEIPQENKYANGSVLILKERRGVFTATLTNHVQDNLFTRLSYAEGIGQQNFRRVLETEDGTNVWEIR